LLRIVASGRRAAVPKPSLRETKSTLGRREVYASRRIGKQLSIGIEGGVRLLLDGARRRQRFAARDDRFGRIQPQHGRRGGPK